MLRDAGISVLKSEKDIKESKLTEAPDTMSIKDFAAKMRARKAAQKSENVLDKIKSQLTPDMSVEDQLEVYFHELVPSSGPAKTVAGELIRSIMRILYRNYNDGDLWYTGYGKETCGSSVIYIIKHIKDLFRNFEKMSSYQLEEEDYTNALDDIAGKILVYLSENPELFTTPSNEDSRNTREDLDDYFDLPTYEFDVDASYDENYYDVSDEEIDNFIHDIVRSDLSSGRVNRWASDAWTIEDLEKDDYDTLEDMWEKWFEDFLSEYEREEEYDEEDEEEDFDESLKEDTIKQGKKWVNKGKEGTHGKFDTKKEADAQRKAMFASGWKG